MLYYQKIKELILDDNEDALRVWMMAQPLTEQLAITQTLKEVHRDMIEEIADVDSKEKDIQLRHMDDFIEEYNDKALEEHTAKLKYEKALAERDKAMEEMEETTAGVRAYLIECVTTNAPNAASMKELAMKIMESEKEHGLYDPENWKGIV